MKFYVKEHKYYCIICGVALHARSLVCIIDKKGRVVKHRNIDTTRVQII